MLAFVACWKGSEGGSLVMLWNVMCDAACSSCFDPKSELKVSGYTVKEGPVTRRCEGSSHELPSFE